ncbi:MAG: hypothetical protein CH6_1285 [Candidatus Kapaibacterium sp.]|nr:MAG: hypothetical protein CH6_1285 [Candidatus Kapabacteria bacterium]
MCIKGKRSLNNNILTDILSPIILLQIGFATILVPVRSFGGSRLFYL